MVANEEAKTHLLQLGENETTIFTIGSPNLDVMNSKKLPTLPQLKEHYGIDSEKYSVVMFHPVTSEEYEIKKYTQNLFKALEQSQEIMWSFIQIMIRAVPRC